MWNQHGVWTAAAVVLVALCDGGPVVAQCEETAKLTSSDGAAGDVFGVSVSISGDVAVVGASRDDDSGDRSGSAYVFRYDGATWVEQAKLTASDGAAEDRFGNSVSISGDVAMVGAYWDDDNGDRSGSAYVFRYDGATWVQTAKLTASDGAETDVFGFSVSTSGDAAIIGAIGDDDNGDNSGSAYVFRYDGATWVEDAKLTASDGARFDYFGRSVSIMGDVAVIGAFHHDHNFDYSGSAYVFRYNGATWMEEAKLTASDGAEHDTFGISVSISGDVAVIGANGDDDNGSSSGSAYVFRYDGATWVEEAKLSASDGAAEDEFGFSVSVRGDVAVIGAYLDDDHNGDRSGSAYIFRYGGATWVEDAKLTASDGAAGDELGLSVSISGDVAVIGAWDGDNGEGSGSVYVYDLFACLCLSDLDGSRAVDLGDIVSIVAVWGNAGGPEDLDDSGTVDFGDILIILGAWGPCPGTTGACCFVTGTCIDDETQTACEAAGGVYLGNQSECVPNSCRGACCFADGTCVALESRTECENDGGSYRGYGTTCDVPCLGACCFDDGTCLDLLDFECVTAGGAYQGDGTVCSATCLGACCFDDGTCLDASAEGDCVAAGGRYRGDGSQCELTCFVGGCCLDEGECLAAIEEACAEMGGRYAGDGTTCTACFGACCFEGATCKEQTTEDDCIAAGGFYQGTDTTCAVTCTLGACCLGAECVVVIEEICAAMSGEFRDGGVCGDCRLESDDCAEAHVFEEGMYSYSTIGSSTDGPDLPPECDEGFGVGFEKDVWFRYQASCDGIATTSVCDSNFRTRLAIYDDGDCPGPFLACNDDACGVAGTRSEVSFAVEAGGVYLIRIGSRTGSIGNGTLVITCDP